MIGIMATVPPTKSGALSKSKWCPRMRGSTASYNTFSAGDVIWDGIRMQGINVWCLLIPKMYFSFDLIDVQLYTVKIWHPCIFSTKIWTSIKSSKKYIFGILKCHISTPCTQIPSQNPSPTYKPFKDTVLRIAPDPTTTNFKKAGDGEWKCQ